MSEQESGDYLALKSLNGDGFGAMYLARDDLGQQVSIEMFRVRDQALAGQITSASSDAGQVLQQRFMDEACILRRQSTSPHIMDLYHFHRLEDGTPYYVMPYL